jgi:hypothetical protein
MRKEWRFEIELWIRQTGWLLYWLERFRGSEDPRLGRRLKH